MGPTSPIRRPAPEPLLPIARLYGPEADFDRARRSLAGGLALAVLWIAPALALALAIVVAG